MWVGVIFWLVRWVVQNLSMVTREKGYQHETKTNKRVTRTKQKQTKCDQNETQTNSVTNTKQKQQRGNQNESKQARGLPKWSKETNKCVTRTRQKSVTTTKQKTIKKGVQNKTKYSLCCIIFSTHQAPAPGHTSWGSCSRRSWQYCIWWTSPSLGCCTAGKTTNFFCSVKEGIIKSF